MTEPPSSRRSARGRRRVRRITPGYLDRAALHYLGRFAASEAQLARILMRKVDRALARGAEGGEAAGVPTQPDRERAAGWVQEIVSECVRLGLVDDRRYAESKARDSRRAGHSRQRILAALRRKGIAQPLAAAALDMLDAEEGLGDIEAAAAFARRRRIGPYGGTGDGDADLSLGEFRRALARFARAGFSYAQARSVLEARSRAELEARIADARRGAPSSGGAASGD